MTTNNMATLQAHLFDVLQGVKEGKIDVERANAVCAVSQQLINTVKAESDFGHRTGLAVSSSMIEVKTPSPVAIAAAEAARATGQVVRSGLISTEPAAPPLPAPTAAQPLAAPTTAAPASVTRTHTERGTVIEREGNRTRHILK